MSDLTPEVPSRPVVSISKGQGTTLSKTSSFPEPGEVRPACCNTEAYHSTCMRETEVALLGSSFIPGPSIGPRFVGRLGCRPDILVQPPSAQHLRLFIARRFNSIRMITCTGG